MTQLVAPLGTGESTTADPTIALRLSGVSKSFGGVKVLREVDMQVRAGTVHFLIGPNGAGKTTLFNIITGYTPCDGGEVEVLGSRATGLSARRLAHRGMARTFQNLQLFESLTVAENVLVSLHKDMKGGLGRALLGVVGGPENRAYTEAYEWLDRFGLAHYAGSRPSDLSYGDRRLVEVVRALATRPRLLLLDEPAAGLGVEARANLLEVLRGLRSSDLTIVLIEHDMRFGMSLADDVTVLDVGTRIAHGTPREVQADPRVVDAYLGRRGATDD
ncbi:MAG: Monosaccharide-transporting ATPase [Nocardioidaceae bacterium]|nr:Monosaccharide-transporting ATPase [Nocardioidaceae bacterium]